MKYNPKITNCIDLFNVIAEDTFRIYFKPTECTKSLSKTHVFRKILQPCVWFSPTPGTQKSTLLTRNSFCIQTESPEVAERGMVSSLKTWDRIYMHVNMFTCGHIAVLYVSQQI